jgi:antitoxin ParD1/3/4
MTSLPLPFPADLQQFVDSQVASGNYPSVAEVVCQAVRLMRDRERRLASLRTEVDQGLTQLDAGDCVTIESDDELRGFFDDIERRSQQRSVGGLSGQ